MQKFWKIILPLLIVVGLTLAFLTHKGVINPEIPVEFNPEPSRPNLTGTCEVKPPAQGPVQKHPSSKIS